MKALLIISTLFIADHLQAAAAAGAGVGAINSAATKPAVTPFDLKFAVPMRAYQLDGALGDIYAQGFKAGLMQQTNKLSPDNASEKISALFIQSFDRLIEDDLYFKFYCFCKQKPTDLAVLKKHIPAHCRPLTPSPERPFPGSYPTPITANQLNTAFADMYEQGFQAGTIKDTGKLVSSIDDTSKKTSALFTESFDNLITSNQVFTGCMCKTTTEQLHKLKAALNKTHKKPSSAQ